MQPMSPLDTRPKEEDYDYWDDSLSGASWKALVAALLVLALLIGAVVVFGDRGSEGQQVPDQTEAPLAPGP